MCGHMPMWRLAQQSLGNAARGLHLAGRDAVSTQRAAGVHSLWRGMQTEYTRWSLRCLFVYGGLSAADDARGGGRGFAYASDRTCPSLSLPSDDSYEGLGHKVKDMIVWVAGHITAYDYLLKTDVDTLICFNRVSYIYAGWKLPVLRKILRVYFAI